MKKKKRTATAGEPKPTVTQASENEKKKYEATKLTVKIFAIVAVVAVIVSIVIAVVVAVGQSERVDYMNDDLSKYIYISPEDYKNISVALKLDPVDEISVDSAIAKALYSKRSLESAYGGKYYTKMPTLEDGTKRKIGIGDTAFIRYLGYYTDKDGEVIYFDGGCNFDKEDAHELGIGSGAFITGFELGLVGVLPEEYSTLGKIEDRGIEEGDLISFTYTVISSSSDNDKSKSNVTATFNVSGDSLDDRYGVGFSDYLIGKRAGKIEGSFTTVIGEDRVVYSDMTIGTVYDLGDRPITVSARFPVTYEDESLAGRTVNYDVYVEKVQLYTVPELNEELILKSTGLSREDLAKYGDEGDDLLACYRVYLEERLRENAKAALGDDITAAFWEQSSKLVKVIRLPQGEVNDYYNDYIADINSSYETQKDLYTSFEEFISTNLLIDKGEDWMKYVRERAELAIVEKLTFYYIIRAENFLPNEQEYEREYNRIVSEMLEYTLERVDCKRENYDTEEEYLAEVNKYKEIMIEGYGEAYFEENVIYEFCMEKIKAMIKVNYK